MIVSGRNDKLFVPAGAEAYNKDLKDAQIRLFNGSHFVLDEKHAEIASLIRSFLTRQVSNDLAKRNKLPIGKADPEFSK